MNNFVRYIKEEHARIRKEDISNLQQDMETQAKQVRSGWITAFMNMKTAFGEALGKFRGSINELEMREDQSRALTTTGAGERADLTEVHADIDKLEDKLELYKAKLDGFLEKQSGSINYHNFGFSLPEEPMRG